MKYAIVPVTPFQQNCSVLKCEATNKVAIVDPGGDLENILAALEQIGGTPEKILVTHAHLDHIGAVADLAERLSLPIEGPHRDDQFWIDMLPQQAQMMGFAPSRPFTPDRWLEGGDSVTVGETRFEVRHCPGHTPGHVVFYQPEAKLVVVGDVLFNGSIGRTDFPKGDHDTLIQAIKNQLLTLDDDVSFIPGHGPMSTIGHERSHNPFVSGKHG
ncbi:MBL fold metallo-hydrolase [Alcanivorax sp.]|jgi:glyoxylase-like metal-dependent hydrolase (beta-lactamase superfamily II)|uniref:MBL fold metallo-hydrolase n=1 Tax=Alcanivorax sp. TaxID=1872427 RepID=UPI0032D9566E